MTKDQAIKWIKEIQTGGFNRNEIVDQIPMGKIAVKLWNDSPEFSLGMEYGAIMALMITYDIKGEDI